MASSLAVYYTTLIPLLAGLRAAPAAWFDLVRSYGRGRWAELARMSTCAPRCCARAGPDR
ncbi:hypothetical protein [Paracoccus mutanolyticus]|uniref:hypothetical protein n=1 Tax=Paracoccus mutanolyticus TaxID=1499308 RepID=UPI0016741F69|nr:hypothetical protein [Paracoccus mutanolyticus]